MVTEKALALTKEQKEQVEQQAMVRALARVTALPPETQEAMTLGRVFAASGLFSDVRTASQAVVKILAGRELGLPPIISMQSIFLFTDSRGKVTLLPHTAIYGGMMERAGIAYQVTEHDDQHCTILFTRHGRTHKETYTIEDARKAGLLGKDNWQKNPKNMLFYRALKNGCRIVAPDIMMKLAVTGIAPETAEEVLPANAQGGVDVGVPLARVATDDVGVGDVTDGDFTETTGPPPEVSKEQAAQDMADLGFDPKPASPPSSGGVHPPSTQGQAPTPRSEPVPPPGQPGESAQADVGKAPVASAPAGGTQQPPATGGHPAASGAFRFKGWPECAAYIRDLVLEPSNLEASGFLKFAEGRLKRPIHKSADFANFDEALAMAYQYVAAQQATGGGQ